MRKILAFCLVLIAGPVYAKDISREISIAITSQDCPRLAYAIENRDMLAFKITHLWSSLADEKQPLLIIAYLDAIERVFDKAFEINELIQSNCS